MIRPIKVEMITLLTLTSQELWGEGAKTNLQKNRWNDALGRTSKKISSYRQASKMHWENKSHTQKNRWNDVYNVDIVEEVVHVGHK